MDEEDRKVKTEPSLSNTGLAFERTIMGHERIGTGEKKTVLITSSNMPPKKMPAAHLKITAVFFF